MTEVHEFVDEGLGHSSYVIDLGDSSAVIVNPPRFSIIGRPGLVARRHATFIAPTVSQLTTAHRGVTDGEQAPPAPGLAGSLSNARRAVSGSWLGWLVLADWSTATGRSSEADR